MKLFKIWCKLYHIIYKTKPNINRLYLYKNNQCFISWSFDDLIHYKIRYLIKQTKYYSKTIGGGDSSL